ncbi:MAG: CRISPR-associated endonuclease Cas2 [Parcubacteria group bacterium]|nr:CRISPR-associated endonuclease Cas2 [Parcubacteria group bacterium]
MRSLFKRKILFTLAAGVALGLYRSPQQYFKIIGDVPKEWRKMKRSYLRDCIREFHHDKLIDFKESSNGICRIILTEKGKKKVIAFDLDNMAVKKPAFWDKKWRVVTFDVPESKRPARNALRDKLSDLGFYSLQKSVFVYPYNCLDEIEFIAEIFQVRPYVRFFEATKITNESELKLHFENIL